MSGCCHKISKGHSLYRSKYERRKQGKVHAWRALGQLRAVEAVEPLLELFDRLEDDDWVHEELPAVFGLIGPARICICTTRPPFLSWVVRLRCGMARGSGTLGPPMQATSCISRRHAARTWQPEPDRPIPGLDCSDRSS